MPREDVFVNDLSGGVEKAVDEVTVSVDALREALQTRGCFHREGQIGLGGRIKRMRNF